MINYTFGVMKKDIKRQKRDRNESERKEQFDNFFSLLATFRVLREE